MRKSLIERLRAGDVVLGSFHDFIEPTLVELVAYAGFDYVVLEHEHGLRDFGDMQHMIRAAQAAGIDVLVRVSSGDPNLIERLLDAGATGVMVAHIKTAEQARAVVRAAKYGPAGTRGEGFTRRGHIWKLGPRNREWQLQTNEETLVFAIIEDVEGVENIEEILAVEGLNGVVPGPGDLAVDMGGLPVFSDEVQAELQKVRDAVNAREDKYTMSFVLNYDNIADIVAGGSQLVLVGHDTILVAQMYEDLATTARAALGKG